MEPFKNFTGSVVPLDRANVDTDAIIPKQFLKSIKRSGFGPYLFDEWRYLDHGEPGMDCTNRPLNTSFVLNDPRYAGAEILLARENFGCGSSREHAPWALADFGIRVILARVTPTYFLAIALKMAYYRLFLRQKSSIVCLLKRRVQRPCGWWWICRGRP